jgi:hypothetical protein
MDISSPEHGLIGGGAEVGVILPKYNPNINLGMCFVFILNQSDPTRR